MADRDLIVSDDAPSHPTTPAEYLRLEMARRGLSAITLGALLGVHPQTLYNILSKDPRKISAKLALSLSRHLGRTVDFWLAERLPLQLVESAAPEESEEEPVETTIPGSIKEGAAWNPEDPPTLQVDQQVEKYLDLAGSGLAIHGLDRRCVRSTSVDLAIGYVIPGKYERGLRDKWTLAFHSFDGLVDDELTREISAAGFLKKYMLAPGKSVIVVSREYFKLGANFIGRAGQNTGTLLLGLQVLHGLQVDPGYSGPLFMRVLNVSDDPIEVCEGMRLASVEIYRLPLEPNKKYQENAESRIARLAEHVFDKIAGMFSYSIKDGLVYKASLKGLLDWTYASDMGDVQERAVDWIKEMLANDAAPDHGEVERGVRDVLDLILISEEDAAALQQHFGIPLEIYKTVTPHFAGGRQQTLADTIARMDRRLNDLAPTLIDEAIRNRNV